MGCNHCDDCSECSVGGGLGCDLWEPSGNSHDDWMDEQSYGDDDYGWDIEEDETDDGPDLKYCVHCGRRVGDTWRYCLRCGAEIPSDVSERPASPERPPWLSPPWEQPGFVRPPIYPPSELAENPLADDECPF